MTDMELLRAENADLRAEVQDLKSERDEAKQTKEAAGREVLEAAEQLRRLRDEVAALKAERDRARRLYCYAQAATIRDGRPEAIAAELEWDCFKEVQP